MTIARNPHPLKHLCLAILGVLATAMPDGLYEARAIVTGSGAATRAEGFAIAFADVLVKLTGNPALRDDPRVAALADSAGAMVEDFAYLDRMTDQPRRDEQGSRDRPFTLIAHFAPARIDAVLASLAEPAWTAPRPRLMVRVTISRAGAAFPLTADGDNDERHRQALLAAADRYGMRVVLLGSLAQPPEAPETVSGTLVWSDPDYGWVGAWQMTRAGRAFSWGIRGVSFDEAFRNMVSGAMAILSGHENALPK